MSCRISAAAPSSGIGRRLVVGDVDSFVVHVAHVQLCSAFASAASPLEHPLLALGDLEPRIRVLMGNAFCSVLCGLNFK